MAQPPASPDGRHPRRAAPPRPSDSGPGSARQAEERYARERLYGDERTPRAPAPPSDHLLGGRVRHHELEPELDRLVEADSYEQALRLVEELVARLAAMLERGQPSAAAPARVVSGDLIIDFARRGVTVGGRAVQLSPTEYSLLHCLAVHSGRILAPEEVLQRVWGRGYGAETELLHSAVRRLRRKIEPDPAAPRYVLTARGVGYWLANPGPD